jgi:hypothetical protein
MSGMARRRGRAEASPRDSGGWFRALGRLAGVAGAAGALLCAGCATAGAERLVGAGSRALTDADRAIVEQLLASPEVQHAAQLLTRSVVDAAMQDLGAQERQAQVRQLAGGFAEGVVPVVVEALDRKVLPRVRQELIAGVRDAAAAAVQAAFAELQSADNRGRAEALSGELAAAAARGAAPAVASAITTGVRSGITRAVAELLGGVVAPGGGGAAGGGGASAGGAAAVDFDRRLGKVMRAGSQGAFLGLADALHGALGAELRQQQTAFLDELHRAAAAERQAWIQEINAERSGWERYVVILAVAAGLLLLALCAAVAWLSHLWRENRRLRGGA